VAARGRKESIMSLSLSHSVFICCCNPTQFHGIVLQQNKDGEGKGKCNLGKGDSGGQVGNDEGKGKGDNDVG
jgi:hypothetical protein